jgi:cobalt-zinc-cadmium efflux system outer membrane protein
MRGWNKKWFSFLTNLYFLCGVNVAFANDILTLPDAIDQTLKFNADLQLFPYQVRAAEALKIQATLKPQTTFNLDIENAFGTGDNTGLSNSETTLSLGQVIELGGKQANRLGEATAQIEQIRQQYNLKRLDILAETSRRYHEVLRLQALNNSYSRYIKEAQKSLKIIERQARFGSVGLAHIIKIKLEIARAQASQKQWLTQAKQEKKQLAMMWQGAVDFSSVAGTLTQAPSLPTQQQMTVKFESLPKFALQQAQTALALEQLELAKANGVNDVEVGLGFRHFAETDDQALVFQFSMPLGQQNPNQGNILAAQTRYEQSQLQQTLLHKTLQLALKTKQESLFANYDYAKTLRDELLPKAKRLLKETAKGYQYGQYSILEWIDAQKTQFVLIQESINTHNQIYLELLALEKLSGQPLLTDSGVNND